MKALYYPDWDRLEIREVDRPSPSTGEVLVRVAACGICGSEIESFLAHSPRRTPPLVMGHEFCGTVEEIGDGVVGDDAPAVGDRVVCNAVLHCGACPMCVAGHTNLCRDRGIFGMNRPGAFAEFVSAPVSTIIGWPDGVPAREACLAEPLGNGLHVVARLAGLKPSLVTIIGAGSIGLMCLQAVRIHFDSKVIVADIDAVRLESARRLGADAVFDPSQGDLAALVADQSDSLGSDVVIDAAGVGPTKELSLSCCRPGGCVVWIGLGANDVRMRTYDVTLGERSILGSYGATAAELAQALSLIADGRVDVSTWIESYQLANGVDAFMRQLNHETRDIKAVLIN